MKISEVKIDNEFRDYLPANDDNTREGLEQSVRLHGFTDPICVWKGTNILVDGHHRYNIWMQDQQLPEPDIKELEFDSRESAINFIVSHQLSRRNLKPKDAAMYRGRLYNKLKKTQGEKGNPGSTAAKIAEQTGVSAATVRRDAAKAADLEKISVKSSKKIADAVASNGTSRQKIKEIASSEDVSSAASNAIKPKPKPKKATGTTATLMHIKNAKVALDKASGLLVRAERESGGESVYSRKVLKAFNPLMAALEEWDADLTF
jgi:ParB-like chromosome segregation protein Spo0J